MTKYETKTIHVKEEGPGLYGLVITRIDIGQNDVWAKEGWGRDKMLLMVNLMSGGRFETYHDLHQLKKLFKSEDRTDMLNFFDKLKYDNELWDRIEDGSRYEVRELKEMTYG